MTLLEETCAALKPIDAAASENAQRLLDAKTKPRRSLGRLEELACRLAGIYRTSQPGLPQKAVVVMAADHGVSEEGVSAYPSEVTAQMLANFAVGGAAINVLARQAAVRVVVVDMGTKASTLPSGVLDHRLGAGTANFTREPAMIRDDAVRAIETGIRIADDLVSGGFTLIGLGDMGIGNTTAAAAITAALTGIAPARITGHGTGIDEDRRLHKTRVIERALARHRPDGGDALDVLAKVGGFEIAGLAGVALGAAARGIPVVVDGFITASAALAATRLGTNVTGYLIAAHRSVEPGHSAILETLRLWPLLDLQMRLGEGTGGVLAMHLIDAALLILRDMATFESAGVTDTGS
jgi:nicotinate-nucleotide--dimethylbenzimidazole phosphoribosyltransferase